MVFLNGRRSQISQARLVNILKRESHRSIGHEAIKSPSIPRTAILFTPFSSDSSRYAGYVKIQAPPGNCPEKEIHKIERNVPPYVGPSMVIDWSPS